MKTISTLLVIALAMSAPVRSNAQIAEGFETSTLEQLTANCWQFYGASRVTNTSINGAYALELIPTTSDYNTGNSNTGQVVTPYLNFTNSSTLSFNYRLSGTGGSRWVNVRLYDLNSGLSPVIATIPLTATTKTSVSITVPAGSGMKKLVIDVLGSGGGNVYEYFDDIVASAPKVATANCEKATPLPIKLLSFNGTIANNRVNLEWSVAENETGDRFEVEKSVDGSLFSKVALVFNTDKAGTETYSFRDAKDLLQKGYYRLKILNKDNSTAYSKVVTLSAAIDLKAWNLVLLQNPVTSTLKFAYQGYGAQLLKVGVYNMAGIKVYSTEVRIQKGGNVVSLNVEGKFSPGTYVLEVTSDTQRSVAKMIKK